MVAEPKGIVVSENPCTTGEKKNGINGSVDGYGGTMTKLYPGHHETTTGKKETIAGEKP